MSVCACDRVGCNNVMCDRYSWKRQEYICEECFEQLVLLGPGVPLDLFMKGGFRDCAPDLDASRAYFNAKFPLDSSR